MLRKDYHKLILVILFIKSGIFLSFSQAYEVSNGNNQVLETRFVIPKMEVKAKQSVFNLFIIKNINGKPFNGTVQFDVPDDWQFIGDLSSPVSLQPSDSIVIPCRVLVSSKVLGEIAYVVVANVNDRNDRPVKSDYCYMSVPRLPSASVKVSNQMLYFDQKTNKATVKYSISNKGNINELVNITLVGPTQMTVNNNPKNRLYIQDLSVPPHSDSTIVFEIGVDVEDYLESYYKLEVNSTTQDTSFKSTLWLNRIGNSFTYLIPDQNKCAIVELSINDLFGEFDPTYSLLAKGAILFKRNVDIYYYFQSNSLAQLSDNFWGPGTRVYLGINTKYNYTKIGNVDAKLDQYFYGKGIESTFKYKRSSLTGFYVRGLIDSSSYYGGAIESYPFNKFRLGLGYAEINFPEVSQYSKLALAGIGFKFLKFNTFSVNVAKNITTHSMYSTYDRDGYGISGGYSFKKRKLHISSKVDYGTPEYTGISRGRLFTSSFIRYSFKNNAYLYISNFIRNYKRAVYIDDTLQPFQIRNSNKTEIYHQFTPVTNLSLTYGADYLLESSNQFMNTDLNQTVMFSTINYRLFVSGRIGIPDKRLVISPKFDFGRIEVDEWQFVEKDTLKIPFTNTTIFSLNLTGKYFGGYIQLRNGPFDIYEQYYYFDYNNNHIVDSLRIVARPLYRRLYIIPYYERYFFNQFLHFTIRGNYQMDLLQRLNTMGISTEIAFNLPYHFTVSLFNNSSSRTKKDPLTNATLRYNSTYFQLNLRKEFECNQPRIKYYNLQVFFYRDLNGNRVKDPNEPGINNVLVNIIRDYTDSIKQKDARNEFASKELLSDQTGLIEYNNIQDGNYLVKYMLIGDIVGNFSRSELEEYVVMDDDKTVYIPFAENNKIFGSVVLNRDPLSAMGPQDISNIRVIAEDTKGNTYSALTDKEGNFVLYTPVADYYIVRINNVFYESFDLQQSEYIVKFNGYKQFRVTFVFNEKKRTINYDTDLPKDEIKDDLKVIRKTTLSGRIEHQVSLEPIGATVKIVDNVTNKVITEVNSNSLSGNYTISYAANDNYRIVVEAEGYQVHEENLYYEQVISIQNFTLNIGLKKLGEDSKDQSFIIYDKNRENDFTQSFKPGQKIPMSNLNFGEKDARLSPEAYPELDRLIELLNKNTSVRIEVAGHADDTGTERIDNMIAMRRATAVQKYLTSHGLTEDRIVVKSYSNTRPLVPGTSERAKQKNRRVEITVL
ncbi:MAG: OmpA family protein [Bacteroidales bacterium]